MPWNSMSGGGKNGGPWGQGGGPWGSGPRGGGPWGGPPRGGGPGQPPDIEELVKRSQERLRKIFPGGGGGRGGPSSFGIGLRGALVAIVIVLFLYGLSGLYRVDPGEVGVELVFGEYKGMTQPGLNYNWPYPVGQVETPDVLRVREVNIGIRDVVGRSGADVPEESLMLTGDENIVDVDFRVQWVIDNAPNYLFNIEDPERTVKQVAESAMREVVGRRNIERILTQERQEVEAAVMELMQTTLNQYTAGISIRNVQMLQVDPPAQVIDAFRDVQAARADEERLQNEAEAYANRVVPEARGDAAQIIERANAYRDQVTAEATGQADRFVKVYDEYRQAPDVTRERIYLETIEQVFGDTDKVIIDQSVGGNGVVPYLPLDRLRQQGTDPQQTQGARQ